MREHFIWSRRSILILSVVFAVISLAYYFWCITRIGQGYLPFWSDETIYFIDTNSFLLNNNLGAALVFNETFSRIGEFGYHGFAYTLYNGFLISLFNLGQNAGIIYINFFTFLFTLLLISVCPGIKKEEKITLVALFCGNCTVSVYLFTYMQETIHFPLAFIASFLLYKIYNAEKHLKLFVGAFVLIILLASILRINWIFWLIGLVPLLRGWRQLLIFFALYGALTLILFVLTQQINAPYPLWPFSQQLGAAVANREIGQAIIVIVKNTLRNAYTYLSPLDDANLAYTYSNYLPILGLIYFAFEKRSSSRTRKLYLACAAVILINLTVLFVLYSVADWREVRTQAPIVYLITTIIVLTKKPRLIICLLIVQILLSFVLYLDIESKIRERSNIYLQFTQKVNECNDIKSFTSELKGQEKITVLIFDDLFTDGLSNIFCLPLTNSENVRIRYSVDFRGGTVFDPQKLNYVLTNKNIENPNVEKIRQTDVMTLYKVK